MRTISTALVIAAGLAAVTAVTAAAERATFILTNGEKVSGTVVFHTEERTNIRADKNEFNVGLLDGTEAPIPFHQVALIDFAGGTPRPAELAAIKDEGHTLALRVGAVEGGRLVDLIGGDTVRWRTTSGEIKNLPIREVARVYLNADASRTIFNYTPAPPQSVPQLPGGEGGVLVQANVLWNDTGITVRKGDRVRFVTTGEIRFRDGEGQIANADGNGAVKNPRFPVPSMPVGGLIARVSAYPAFPIGSNSNPIVMPNDGRLMLAVNDDNYADNQGAFRVQITRVRPPDSRR